MGAGQRGRVVESSVTVRTMGVDDLDEVMEIDRLTPLVPHWGRAAYEKYAVASRNGIFHRCALVAVGDDAVAGFVAGSFLEGDAAAVLENLAVKATEQRKGAAMALCAAFSKWAREQGAEGVELEVRVGNVAARGLYARLGFIEQGRRAKYYRDPEEDAMLMRVELEPVAAG